MDRTSLSCAWLEAPHKQIYDQGGSPQISLHTHICVEPLRMPHRLPLHMFIGFQTEIHVKPRASPQAELRPGSLPTSRITTRELAGWLAGGITTREPVMRLAGWLAGWGAGWLAEAQRGPERPREAQRGGPWIEQACHALGWSISTSRCTTREAPH